jgi:inhibitor of cysteine peptidase
MKLITNLLGKIMKNFVIIYLAVCASLLAGCASTTSTKTLTIFDNNKQISVTVGQVFVVKLSSNPTTGYRWRYQPEQTAILEQVGEPAYRNGASPIGNMGGGGTVFFTFKANNVGQQVLTFEYSRPFEKDVNPAQTATFNLAVVANEK